MVVSVTDFVVTTPGAGLVSFVYGKPYDRLSDLRCAIISDLTGLTRTPVFAATGPEPGAGATINITSEPGGVPALDLVIMWRETALQQPIDYEQGDFPSATHQRFADRTVMALQEAKRDASRSVVVAVDDPGRLQLPPVLQRKNQFLGFDAAGNLVAVGAAGPGGVPVSDFWKDVLTNGDAVASRADLEVAGLDDANVFDGPNVFEGLTSFANDVGIAADDSLFFGDGDEVEALYATAGDQFILRAKSAATWFRQRFSNFEIAAFDGVKLFVRGLLDGAVELYHNGVKKFETTAAGATVTGVLVETARAGEKWHLVARSAGTFYQNTTGRLIRVAVINESSNASGSLVLSVNDVAAVNTVSSVVVGGTGSGYRNTAYADVPPGHYYHIAVTGGVSIYQVRELS